MNHGEEKSRPLLHYHAHKHRIPDIVLHQPPEGRQGVICWPIVRWSFGSMVEEAETSLAAPPDTIIFHRSYTPTMHLLHDGSGGN